MVLSSDFETLNINAFFILTRRWLNAVVIVVFFAVTPALAQEVSSGSTAYSDGMNAYMGNDFEAARLHWLNAAKENDGRAMFNLGLLHERQRISDASPIQADSWFRQAGDAGYAPADYHLALRAEANGNSAEAQRLLQRAASTGFILAKERLGLAPQDSAANPVSQRSDRQGAIQSSSTASTEQATNTIPNTATERVRLYQREDWILRQAANSWTVQMLAFSDEAKVRNFIDDHALHRNAAYFAEGRGEDTVYKLIYGAYATKQLADQARGRFTSALKEHGPWLRPIEGIQSLIKSQ